MLVRVPEMFNSLFPEIPPVIAPKGVLTGVSHVYVVPTGTISPFSPPFCGVISNDTSEQIAIEKSEIWGVGLTIISKSTDSP